MWTPRSVRSTASPRAAPPTATPRFWAITRWWRCATTPARCCILGCGRDRLSAGHSRFVRETLARVRRLAAGAALTVRADSGFFSYEMLDAIEDHQARYSITVAQDAQVKAAIAAIDEDAWQSIAYTRGGQAQVAETTITTSARSRSRKPRTLRLIVRRTRLVGAQAELWPNWRHHAFITDRDDLDTRSADAYHRGHARVELAIKDLKDNGLRRCPSGRFLRQRRLSRLRRTRPQPPALDSPPRTPPPHRTAHRRRHRAQPAPHSARTPPQPQRPPQTAPPAQLALAEHLHHSAGTHPQPAPAHLTSSPGPAQPTSTPSATNPPAPHTPSPHTPPNTPARPHTPTRHQPT